MEAPRLLLNETEHEIDIRQYRGSKEGFILWQQYLDPLYYQRTLKDRVTVAIHLAFINNGPEVIRISLAHGPLPPLAHAMTTSYGETLLNAVASAMGKYMVKNTSWITDDYSKIVVTGMNLEQATPKV